MLIQRIPGVYNYCDRWCERCRFQQSCDVYPDVRCLEAGIPVEHEVPERDWHDPLEIPPVTPEDMAQCTAERRRRDELTDQHPIGRRVSLYSRRVREWNQLQNPDRSTDPVVSLARESIHWLSPTVSVKVHRAVHELVGRHTDADWVDRTLDPRGVQSDGNGTAKLVRLLLRELLDAWRVVATDPHERGELDRDLSQAFPFAMEFIRPGFDD